VARNLALLYLIILINLLIYLRYILTFLLKHLIIEHIINIY